MGNNIASQEATKNAALSKLDSVGNAAYSYQTTAPVSERDVAEGNAMRFSVIPSDVVKDKRQERKEKRNTILTTLAIAVGSVLVFYALLKFKIVKI